MTPEQKQRIEQIQRDVLSLNSPLTQPIREDIGFLLSLVKGQEVEDGPSPHHCANPNCIDGKVNIGCAVDAPLITIDCPECHAGSRTDKTRFIERGFTVVENAGHSLRLIDRDDARHAINIKWEDLSALRELITLALESVSIQEQK